MLRIRSLPHFSSLRHIRNPPPTSPSCFWEKEQTVRRVDTTITQKERLGVSPQAESPPLSSHVHNFGTWFQQTLSHQNKNQVQYTTGYMEGFQAGLWKGRKDTFLYGGAFLGFFAFLNLLKSGQRSS